MYKTIIKYTLYTLATLVAFFFVPVWMLIVLGIYAGYRYIKSTEIKEI